MPGLPTTYGYKPPKPKPAGTIASAAASPLSRSNSYLNPYGLPGASQYQMPFQQNAAPASSLQLDSYQSAAPKAPSGTVMGQPVQGQAVNTAPTGGTYDINTDPALQQVEALTGLSDTQAKAEALKERQQLLLQYGDQSLAQSILGANDPTAAAAGKSTTSTLAQLNNQRTQDVKQLSDALNKANLFYGGYRVDQEGQAAQNYQNALAQAAGAVQSALGGIDTNLNSTLNQNAMQRAAAMQQAALLAQQAAINAPGPSFTPPLVQAPPPPQQTPTPPQEQTQYPLTNYFFGRLMAQ
jgi:hypothetical protein